MQKTTVSFNGQTYYKYDATFDYVVLQRQFKNYMKWLEGEITRLKGKLAKRTSKNV